MANKWMQHVKQVSAKNKGLSLKEILIKAKGSYKKQKQQGGGSFAENAAAVDAAPVKEDFNQAGGEEKEDKAEEVALQAGGKKTRKNRKNRNNKNNKNNKQQGGKRRSRKNKGKKSKRRAAGKKARRTRRRRRR